MTTKKNQGRTHSLNIAVMSLASGIGCAFLSQILGLKQTVDYWFFLGACLCFFSIGYVEGIDAFREWKKNTPAFLGLRYWIKKTLRGDK